MHSRLALTRDPSAASRRLRLQVCACSLASSSFESCVDSYEDLLPFVGVFHSFPSGTAPPPPTAGVVPLSSSRDRILQTRREMLSGTNTALGAAS